MDVVLETGKSRAFASALEWPGYCRRGKSDDAALAALVAYGTRYAAAIGPEWGFRPPATVDDLRVVERLEGGGGTDFGVPSRAAADDDRPVDGDELQRLTGLLRASWAAFDKTAAAAAGHELRKGPRGGGRDLAKIVTHVAEAEEAYLAGIGGSTRSVRDLPPDARVGAVRVMALETMADRAQGVSPEVSPRRTRPLWTPRYFARRSAWHALDHAWEIEDRV